MKQFAEWFRFFKNRETSHDLLRRYLEADTSPSESRTIQNRLKESDEFRREREKVERYLSTLRSLPHKKPSAQVWERIQQRIETESPKQVWFPWFYAQPAWGIAVKIVPVFILFILVIGFGNTLWIDSRYDVILVDEANGFGREAESYVVYHDLAGEPSPLRESLVAFCTNQGSK